MTTIYTIFLATNYELAESGFPFFGNSRIVGYFTDKQKAIEAVKENALDIHEYYYDYAIIETVREGIYNGASPSERIVYKWTEDGYVQIDDFDCMKHFSGFTIG